MGGTLTWSWFKSAVVWQISCTVNEFDEECKYVFNCGFCVDTGHKSIQCNRLSFEYRLYKRKEFGIIRINGS